MFLNLIFVPLNSTIINCSKLWHARTSKREPCINHPDPRRESRPFHHMMEQPSNIIAFSVLRTTLDDAGVFKTVHRRTLFIRKRPKACPYNICVAQMLPVHQAFTKQTLSQPTLYNTPAGGERNLVTVSFQAVNVQSGGKVSKSVTFH